MINLFIIDPSNLNEKYKLEFELQKIWYKSDYKINYIPSKFPEYKFFNKFFSIIDYFRYKKIPNYSFYLDHDVFIYNKKFIKNIYDNQIFLNYKNHQNFNWKKLFKKKLNLKISSNFTQRFSSCFFPLYQTFLNELDKELKIFYQDKKLFILYSGLFEEYFFTKVILNNKYSLINFETNKKDFIYVQHYQFLEKFKIEILKKDKSSLKSIKKLIDIYKGKK